MVSSSCIRRDQEKSFCIQLLCATHDFIDLHHITFNQSLFQTIVIIYLVVPCLETTPNLCFPSLNLSQVFLEMWEWGKMGQVGREMKPVLHTVFRILMNMNLYRNKMGFTILFSASFSPQFLSAQSTLLSIWSLSSRFQKDTYYFSRIVILFFPTRSIRTLDTKLRLGFQHFLTLPYLAEYLSFCC